jgi:hypothetical protein
LAAVPFRHGVAFGTDRGFVGAWNGESWDDLGRASFSYHCWLYDREPYVFALVEYDGGLAVGGTFDALDGEPVGYVAWFDGESWRPLGLGVNAQPTCWCDHSYTYPCPWVRTLTTWDGRLVAGGDFTEAGGRAASRVASWDGSTWSALGEGLDGSARVMLAHDDALVVGGAFGSAGGNPASNVARWNGSTWEALGGGTSAAVSALCEFEGDLIAGGAFTSAGGNAANRVARWDGVRWSPLGSGMDGQVSALISYRGRLLAGGQFEHADGRPAGGLAIWGGRGWESVAALGGASPSQSASVFALAANRAGLAIGGEFSGIDRVGTVHAAVKDDDAWHRVGTGMGLFGHLASGLLVFDGKLVVSGIFSVAGATVTGNVAAWNGRGWEPLGAGLGGVRNPGIESTIHEGELFAAGLFDRAGELAADGLASWNGHTWHPVSPAPRDVSSLASYRALLVAAGRFTDIGGVPHGRIAGWDGSGWTALSTGANDAVWTLAVHEGDLVAGGRFVQAGGTVARRVARWDGAEWEELGGGFDDGAVVHLIVVDGELYAAGSFTHSRGQPVTRIVRFDGVGWASLPGAMSANVVALGELRGSLVASGVPGQIDLWRGGTWAPLATPFYSPALALVEFGDDLYATGSHMLARWMPGDPGGSPLEPRPGSGFGDPEHPFSVRVGPNPTGGRLRISFSLPSPGIPSLDIHDVAGRKVATLLRDRPAYGPSTVMWDGRTDDGSWATAGTYFLRLQAGEASVTHKLTYLPTR